MNPPDRLVTAPPPRNRHRRPAKHPWLQRRRRRALRALLRPAETTSLFGPVQQATIRWRCGTATDGRYASAGRAVLRTRPTLRAGNTKPPLTMQSSESKRRTRLALLVLYPMRPVRRSRQRPTRVQAPGAPESARRRDQIRGLRRRPNRLPGRHRLRRRRRKLRLHGRRALIARSS